MLLAQVSPEILNVTQFGVAGLMGALWWWERRYSRQREDQLTAAHERILQQREHLQALLEALNGNTKVIMEFTAVQEEIVSVLRGAMRERDAKRDRGATARAATSG